MCAPGDNAAVPGKRDLKSEVPRWHVARPRTALLRAAAGAHMGFQI